jgi:hypothetical protein
LYSHLFFVFWKSYLTGLFSSYYTTGVNRHEVIAPIRKLVFQRFVSLLHLPTRLEIAHFPLVQRSYLTGLFSSYYTTSVNGHGAKLFVLQPAVQIAFNKTANASAVYADQLPDFGNDANVRTFWQSTNGPFQVGNPYWQVRLRCALTTIVDFLTMTFEFLTTIVEFLTTAF